MAEIRVAKCAGFTACAGERSRGHTYLAVFRRTPLSSAVFAALLFTRCSEHTARYRPPAPRLAYNARRRGTHREATPRRPKAGAKAKAQEGTAAREAARAAKAQEAAGREDARDR